MSDVTPDEKILPLVYKLANLYLNAVIIFGYICDVLDQDHKIRYAGDKFKRKHKEVSANSQNVIDFLFTYHRGLVLSEPAHLDNLSCEMAISLSAEIESLLQELHSTADECNNALVLKLIQSLSSESPVSQESFSVPIKSKSKSHHVRPKSTKREKYTKKTGKVQSSKSFDSNSKCNESSDISDSHVKVKPMSSVQSHEQQMVGESSRRFNIVANQFQADKSSLTSDSEQNERPMGVSTDKTILDSRSSEANNSQVQSSKPSNGKNVVNQGQAFQLKMSEQLQFVVFLKPNLTPLSLANVNKMIQLLKDSYPKVKISLANAKWENDKPVDLVIVCGGDGTLLHAVSSFTTKVPPIVGFQAGNLNYLLYYDLNENVQSVFHSIFNGSAMATIRHRLVCHIFKNNTANSSAFAINEICLHRGQSSQTVTVEVILNGCEVLTIVGDGVLFATPTGSSAYCMAAGGSIVHPEVLCFQVLHFYSMLKLNNIRKDFI